MILARAEAHDPRDGGCRSRDQDVPDRRRPRLHEVHAGARRRGGRAPGDALRGARARGDRGCGRDARRAARRRGARGVRLGAAGAARGVGPAGALRRGDGRRSEPAARGRDRPRRRRGGAASTAATAAARSTSPPGSAPSPARARCSRAPGWRTSRARSRASSTSSAARCGSRGSSSRWRSSPVRPEREDVARDLAFRRALDPAATGHAGDAQPIQGSARIRRGRR